MFKKNPQPQPSPALEESASSTDLVSRRAKLEDERMSRRQALRKMGILSGVAVLALVSVDDLARLAAKQLAAHSGDSEVAGAVAKSLKSAGVAFADPNTTNNPDYPYWNQEDCKQRCKRTSAAYLARNVPPQDANGNPQPNAAANVFTTCQNQNPAPNDWDARYTCEISLLAALYPSGTDIHVARQAQFESCCEQFCNTDSEDTTGSCATRYFYGQ